MSHNILLKRYFNKFIHNFTIEHGEGIVYWRNDWKGLIFLLASLMAIFFLLLFLSGVFQILQAVWELRKGDNRNAFIGKGILGMALITVAFVAPYLFLFMSSVTSVQQIQHYTVP